MTIRNFVPEIWSSRLLVATRKALVYAAPRVVNRDYEGDIEEAGDTVRITSVSRPAIGTYVPGTTTITPEKLTTGQRTLVVDQAKYWAFSVDDVDKRQAKSNLIPAAMSEAAYGLADTIDQYVAGLYTQIQAANFLNVVGSPIDTYTTPTDAYDKVLVPLRTKLTKANVPSTGRYVIVPPEFYASLLLDSRFIKSDEAGTDAGLRNGYVGRAANFDIYESNNCPVPTGDTTVVQAGVNAAITFAEQINKTEAYRPESSFSDAVKGLALYGAKVIRPDHLAAAFINPAA
ncbi:P22 phage major capsid protein family protein [Streptomyces scabiei]|uniref:P22 phage major capsid protein family protein n=1 Tax=Streptomyces scabiei TaxID=1930 RepID=UPI0007658BDE|nr:MULTISPECIES: P22 phage major capsid protein family protein [Streptomyces]MBP5862791.1 P22 coat protein - protein 5 domain protein [Streptomyces sp. LBUM 1484]MBP5876757.1 P22 coat protein - protein 5 domain protein [Streptomyces sp. LBUM 1477]MBP5884544.1 P22 coat protein - protein 5 domain protein [Streptomyces sp. LBUM 1487]QTU47611.1 P22 coat protein - protein 5 domain protein [Streptomyces sp. LBUM 1482]